MEAIGVLLAGLAALISLPKIANKSLRRLKDEAYYNNEAYIKYKEIESMLPEEKPFMWGPVEWEGGQTLRKCLK